MDVANQKEVLEKEEMVIQHGRGNVLGIGGSIEATPKGKSSDDDDDDDNVSRKNKYFDPMDKTSKEE